MVKYRADQKLLYCEGDSTETSCPQWLWCLLLLWGYSEPTWSLSFAANCRAPALADGLCVRTPYFMHGGKQCAGNCAELGSPRFSSQMCKSLLELRLNRAYRMHLFCMTSCFKSVI